MRNMGERSRRIEERKNLLTAHISGARSRSGLCSRKVRAKALHCPHQAAKMAEETSRARETRLPARRLRIEMEEEKVALREEILANRKHAA